MAGPGIRKLPDIRPTPLRERANGQAAPEPRQAPERRLPTLAQIDRQIAGLFGNLQAMFLERADASEREHDRIDSELVSLTQGLDEQVQRDWWPLLMNVNLAATYTGISTYKLAELARRGDLPRVWIGGSAFFRRDDLDQLAKAGNQ